MKNNIKIVGFFLGVGICILLLIGIFFKTPVTHASFNTAVDWGMITHTPTTLSGYGIVDAYPLTGNPSGFLTSFTTPTSFSQWHKITKSYTDFSTAGATRTITIYTPATNEIIESVRMIPTQTFTGGIIATYTISMGQLSTTDLLTASSVFTLPAVMFGANPLVLTSLSPGGVTTTAVATVDTLNHATQGAVSFWVETAVLP